MHIQRAAWAGGCLTMLLALAGCGGGNKDLGEVTGTVTYNGKEVAEGNIQFAAVDGKGEGGGPIKDGKYTATKVPVGRTRVVIVNAVEYTRKKLYKDRPETMAMKKNELPDKFNAKTELEFEVKPGANEKHWELKD